MQDMLIITHTNPAMHPLMHRHDKILTTSESSYSLSSAKSANTIDKDNCYFDVAGIHKLNTHGGSCIFFIHFPVA